MFFNTEFKSFKGILIFIKSNFFRTTFVTCINESLQLRITQLDIKFFNSKIKCLNCNNFLISRITHAVKCFWAYAFRLKLITKILHCFFFWVFRISSIQKFLFFHFKPIFYSLKRKFFPEQVLKLYHKLMGFFSFLNV